MNNDDNPKSFRRHTRADGSIHYADPPAQSPPDIVGRLRDYTSPALAHEAAARIETLEAEVAEWQQAASVEAGLRREFYDRAAALEAALRKIKELANSDDGISPREAFDIAEAALAPEQER